MKDVLDTNEGWTGLESRRITDKISTGYTEWFLSKDNLQVGDTVRSRKSPKSCKPANMDVPEGTVVGMERDNDREGFVLVRIHGIHDPLRVQASSLERVTFGLVAGDWVRLKEEDKKHSPVGVLHSIDRDGTVSVGFIGVETLWKGESSQLQMSESFCIGQFITLKPNVVSPHFEWPRKKGGMWATGRIHWILPNGCLVVKFPGILIFGDESNEYLADPAEVEVVTFSNCPGILKKYHHLEDLHWAVRPLVIVFGIFTAIKIGSSVGLKIGRSKAKRNQIAAVHGNDQHYDGQNVGNPAWLPPPVANMLFKENGSTAATR